MVRLNNTPSHRLDGNNPSLGAGVKVLDMYAIIMQSAPSADGKVQHINYDSKDEAIERARHMACRSVACDCRTFDDPTDMYLQVRALGGALVWSPTTDAQVQGTAEGSAPMGTCLPRSRRNRAQIDGAKRLEMLASVPMCPWDGNEIAEVFGCTVHEGWVIYSALEGELSLGHKSRVFRDELRKYGLPGHRNKIMCAWRDKVPLAQAVTEWRQALDKEKAVRIRAGKSVPENFGLE